MSFILHELHRLTRRHMTFCDVKIHHGSLESGWTLLTFDVIGTVPLYVRKPSINFLLACKSKVKGEFFNKLFEGMNVNINYELNLSEVHEGMNRSGSLTKFT